MPGTDTKLTPEIDEPTIPMATTHQGDFYFPEKSIVIGAFPTRDKRYQ